MSTTVSPRWRMAWAAPKHGKRVGLPEVLRPGCVDRQFDVPSVKSARPR